MRIRSRNDELTYLTNLAHKYPEQRNYLYAVAMVGELGYLEPQAREILNSAVEKLNKHCDAVDIAEVKVDGRRKKRSE